MKAVQSLRSLRSICGDVEVWVESEKEIKRNVAEILTARDRDVDRRALARVGRAAGPLDDFYGIGFAHV